MPKRHTVEKIGGTTMTQFKDVMDNVIIGKRKENELYNRIFVVSAYGGITDLLLENKKTREPGVYGVFAEDKREWQDKLELVRSRMLELNRSFEKLGLDLEKADAFINERIDGVKICLNDLVRLRSYGHFIPEDYLPATREFLSALGEAHSAYNSTLILQANGINAKFADLTGWKSTETCSFEKRIKEVFEDFNYEKELIITTGYVKYDDGIMTKYDRGYSEITFSKIAVMTKALEGIIHKEYHLSTGDPKLIGEEKVKIIGHTNFDITDQLSDMGMEAIHPKAAKDMELKGIPIRIKNAFEPEHPGTLISSGFISENPRVEMICGRDDILALEVFDPEMVGQSGFDYKILECLCRHKISYIAKSTNANTITHFISEKNNDIDKGLKMLREKLTESSIRTEKAAIVSVIGSNMKIPGMLCQAAGALSENNINILSVDQSMRQVNMQFVIGRDKFSLSQKILHEKLVENYFKIP